jgi:hypothetical protein
MQGSGRRSGCPWSRVSRLAPASGRAQWPSRASGAKVEGDAGQRQAIGLPVVKSVPTGASVGPCSIVARSGGSSWSRLRKAPARRTGCQRRAVLVGHRRQAKAMQISVAIAGERFPGERDADHRQASGLPWSRVCRMAPASGRAQWRSRASGARSKAMQVTSSRSGGSSWSRSRKAPTRRTGYQRRAVLGGDRHQANAMRVPDGARFGPCSIVARSGGSSWSRLRKAPTRRTGYQRRAVLGGHRHQANAMQITGSRSGCPWSRVCRMAPASGRAQWRSRASGAKVEGDAGQRQAIGLPVVKGVPDGARVGPCSVAIAGERCQVEGDAGHKQPIGLPVVKGVPAGARVGPCSVAIAGERCQGRR